MSMRKVFSVNELLQIENDLLNHKDCNEEMRVGLMKYFVNHNSRSICKRNIQLKKYVE